MLMAVKNQFNVTLLSIKYALIREMLNKTTFITNILFMILNNASFIIQWVVLFSLKDSIAGVKLHDILIIWGFASNIYGISHFFFKKAYSLSDIITNGKLDAHLVQPKNVLISVITTDVEPSAIGDMLYGIIMLIIYGFTIKRFILFVALSIIGALIITSIAVILASLSFWSANSYMLADTGNSLMTNFATYPDGIFKGVTKIILYTIVPVGFAYYIPAKIIKEPSIYLFIIVLSICILFVFLAFNIFNRGLKKYSSSNLMSARI